MVPPFDETKNKFLQFYQRHEALVSISVFVVGFFFDLITLGRIDDTVNLIQQAAYLLILGALLITEIRLRSGTFTLSPRGEKWWQYHDLVVHFLFGSLLSAYTIFYYTSASALTSFLFIVLLGGLMTANEFPRFQQLGISVRVLLFSICLLSYFAFFYPILMGHVGRLPFWLGIFSSVFVMALIWRFYFHKSGDQDFLRRKILIPAAAIHLFFLMAYFTNLIPPVPVAVKKIGVYYDVIKKDGHYYGSHLRPFWRVWDQGSQVFYARQGDRLIVMLSIFSPGHFEDKIYLKWYFDDPKQGWILQDTIPMTILGGRDEGFRGFGAKQNYQPGHWRVIVETSDAREVGRINLEVITEESLDKREFKTDVF